MRIIQIFFLCLISVFSYGQNHLKLKVIDESGALEGATIVTSEGDFCITDVNGNCVFSCECSALIIAVSYVGHQTVIDTLKMSIEPVTILLRQQAQSLQSITIESSSGQNQLNDPVNQLVFDPKSIAALPFLFGVSDPVKYIQLQAGVSTGTEGNNGYFVRGGGIDQNGILLDKMELFNPNHLMGFFSMFSQNAIDRASFIKSGYPANYGGRLSSVLELETVNPITDKVKGHAGMGLLSLNADIQVPFRKNEGGIMLAYRKSYIDLITQNFFDENGKIAQNTDYKFHDLIGKIHFRTGKKSTLSGTFFTGGDESDFQSSRTFSNQLSWRSVNAGLIWKYQPSSNTFIELYSNAGKYDQQFAVNISDYHMQLQSAIMNWKSGIQISQFVSKAEWTYGVEWNLRKFRPNEVDVQTGRDEFVLQDVQDMNTGEWAAYADIWYKMNARWRVGGGLRLSGFMQFGPFGRYYTDSDGAVNDTISAGQYQIVKQYLGLEPRLRAVFLINTSSSLKLSFDRTYQYIHLSPLSSVSLPADLWLPSTEVIKPQLAHQVAVGYSHLGSKMLDNYSVTAYGKLLNNQLEWKNGTIAGYSNSPNLDDDLIFGGGYSFGIETQLSKKMDKLDMEVNYTLSRTIRHFDAIDNGQPFPAKYDRIHDLNFTASYKTKNWVWSGLFKMASGTALTLPIAKYVIGERIINEYSTRNSLRMPMYHRMDVSATWQPPKHQHSTWSFSIYNLYNRSNPYFIYFDVQGSVEDYSLDIDLKQVSLFPVLPSIAYEFRF